MRVLSDYYPMRSSFKSKMRANEFRSISSHITKTPSFLPLGSPVQRMQL